MATTLTIYETAGNSTWTKPADCALIEAVVVSGGGGGGSGVNQPSAQGRSGGGGGGGGGVSRIFIVASSVAATVIAQVGAVGTGGARQTAGPAGGNVGTAGGDSAFYNGANLYGRSTGGGGGGGGNGGSASSAVGTGGWGTWRGGDGGSGVHSAVGSMGGWAQGVVSLGGTQVLAVGGSGGGGIDASLNNYAGGAGRWSPQTINGLAHPTNPAGGVTTGAPGASAGVNSLSRSLYGAVSGGGGAWSGTPGTVPNAVPKGAGGSGGGANSTNGAGSGNGGNGGPGAVYVMSYTLDVDIRQGTVRSSVAMVGTSASGRRATFASVAPLTATSAVTSKASRKGASSAPLAATVSLTHRQGSSVGQVTVIGQFRSGPLKGAHGLGVVIGTATGTAKRTGAVRSTVAVLGRASLGRRVAGQVRSQVTVIGTFRARRFILVTPPVAAEYLDRPTRAHYHQGPTRAEYEVNPTRAHYDGGMGERIPWMAGAMRGSIRASLTDANGPLPGMASALSVRFTARRMDDGLGLVDGFATIEDALNAIVRYDPVPGDFAVPGQYAVQWIVSHSGALPQFVPDDGYDEMDCLAPVTAP